MTFLILLASLLTVRAQNVTQACTCYCGAPSDDGYVWGIYGAYPIPDCAYCTADNAKINCPNFFPDSCSSATSFTSDGDCGPVDMDDDWSGDWVFDPCSACLLDEKNHPVGDCKPCCDPANCIECLYGTITISTLGEVWINGKLIHQLQASTNGTTSHQSTNIANETGNLGTTATLTVLDTYDLIKHGDALQILSRTDSLDCSFTATRNPPKPSMLKLALLLGGVGLAVIGVIVFCCCNPCKKKKVGEKLLNGDAEQGQGQEGVPHSQTPQIGNINYTGEQSMQTIK